MKHGQIVVELQPRDGGGYTDLWLSGCLPTSLPSKAVRRAVRWLALHSGWPVDFVLRVDKASASWWAVWSVHLTGLSERHLALHFEVRRDEDERGSL